MSDFKIVEERSLQSSNGEHVFRIRKTNSEIIISECRPGSSMSSRFPLEIVDDLVELLKPFGGAASDATRSDATHSIKPQQLHCQTCGDSFTNGFCGIASCRTCNDFKTKEINEEDKVAFIIKAATLALEWWKNSGRAKETASEIFCHIDVDKTFWNAISFEDKKSIVDRIDARIKAFSSSSWDKNVILVRDNCGASGGFFYRKKEKWDRDQDTTNDVGKVPLTTASTSKIVAKKNPTKRAIKPFVKKKK